MKQGAILRFSGITIAGLIAAGAEAVAHPPVSSFGAAEIAQALRGKICTSRIGAKFTFARDGHYAYDGLWISSGHYSVHDGGVSVLFDSGLQRDFAISRREGVLRMEETVLTCATQTALKKDSRGALAMPTGRIAAAYR